MYMGDYIPSRRSRYGQRRASRLNTKLSGVQLEQLKRYRASLGGLAAGQTTNTQAATSGASQGAAVGSAIVPGIGTAIGAVVGAAYGLLSNKHTAKSEIVWDEYKRTAGAPGTSYDSAGFEQSFEGMWKTNNKALGGVNKQWPSREPMKVALVEDLAKALVSGQVQISQGSNAIYNSFVLPWLTAHGADANVYGKLTDPRRQIMLDLTDRILANIPVGRDSVIGLKGNTDLHVPTLQEAIAKITPPSSQPNAATPPAVATIVTGGNGQPSIAVPSAPPVTANQAPGGATPLVSPQAAADATALIQSMLANNASQADVYKAALTKLQASGVPITPQLQQSVASEIKAQSVPTSWYVIGGVIAIAALAYFTRSKRR